MRNILNNPEFRARLYRRVDIDLFPNAITGTPCWRWKGAPDTDGYGRIAIGKNKFISTHRAAYIIERGPIPTGFELDHICRNHPCCNPDHLQPVTRRENARRGLSGHSNGPHRPRQRRSDKRSLLLPFEDGD